jgi:hypothetical protein
MKRYETPRRLRLPACPETAIDSAKVVLQQGTPEERKAVDSGEASLRKTADRIRAHSRARAESQPAEPAAGNATRQEGTGLQPHPDRRRHARATMPAESAIKESPERLGNAVKTRARATGTSSI